MSRDKNNKIDVKLLMRESCGICKKVAEEIFDYMNKNDHIDYNIINLDDPTIDFNKRNSSITPALWVDDRMWFAGGFDLVKFDIKLKALLQKKGDYHE